MPARLAALSMATWKRGWRTTLLDRRPSLATTWAGMSRHQMIERVGHVRRLLRRRCWMDGARSPKPVGRRSKARPSRSAAACGARGQLGIVGLGEVDEPAVVAEVHRQQLGMAVEAEAGADDRVELAGQEVGQVEGPELLVLERGVGRRAGVELVAVGALDALEALALEVRVERAGRAAVGVGDEDAGRPRRSARGPPRPWPRRRRRSAAGRMWRRASTPSTRTPGIPAVRARSSRASAPQPTMTSRVGTSPQAALARRSSMSRRAVSAATPASRQ